MQLLLVIADPVPRTVEIEWPTVPKVGEWVTVDADNAVGYSSYKVDQVKLPEKGAIKIRVALSPIELGDARSVAQPNDPEQDEAFIRGAAAEHQIGHLGIPREGCDACVSLQALIDRAYALGHSDGRFSMTEEPPKLAALLADNHDPRQQALNRMASGLGLPESVVDRLPSSTDALAVTHWRRKCYEPICGLKPLTDEDPIPSLSALLHVQPGEPGQQPYVSPFKPVGHDGPCYESKL